MASLLPQTRLRLHEISTLETTCPTSISPLRVIAYTDVVAIGGAEISLSHLVGAVSDDIDVTVVGISEHVVDAIASRRPQAARVVLPEKGLQSAIARVDGVRVVILGEGSQREALETLATELGISERVELDNESDREAFLDGRAPIESGNIQSINIDKLTD